MLDDFQNLSLRQKTGQLFFTGIKGKKLDKTTRRFIQKIQPGGIFIHQKNIEGPKELYELCRDIFDRLYIPPFIAIDQEGGGRVDKFRDFMPPVPFNYTIAQQMSPEMSYKKGLLTGKVLKVLGLNMNFAPVVDLSPIDVDNAIGKRAFSTDPDRTILYGKQYLKGLRETGILSSIKHFPGLGSTVRDSHTELPVVKKSKEKLIDEDIRVFGELSEITDCVMIGHAAYPDLQKAAPPATLSPDICGDLLRKDLDFRGPAITDDLGMNALKDHSSPPELFEKVKNAGSDMMLICHNMETVRKGSSHISNLIGKKIPSRSIEKSVERIIRLKQEIIPPPEFFRKDRFGELCSRIGEVFGNNSD